ncbi:MAG: hypothetical protein ACKO41_00485 [Sphingomonadales bacterium]
MKKLLFVLSLSIFSFTAVMAQPPGGGGGFQRRTPAERVAVIHQKLDSAFKLDPAKMHIIDTVLTVLYKRQDARMLEIREAAMAGERPDPEAMREEMKKYNDLQEETIKSVLTPEQYTIWKDQILPAMRPARGMGGGPGGGGGRRNDQ